MNDNHSHLAIPLYFFKKVRSAPEWKTDEWKTDACAPESAKAMSAKSIW